MLKRLNQLLSDKPDLAIKVALGILSVVVAFVVIAYSDYNLATGTGNLCMVLFIMGNTYVPAKWLRFRYRFKSVAEHFDVFLTFHIYCDIAAFVLCCIHCYVSHWINFWLKVSLVLMGWLILGGFLMKFVYSPQIKKGLYFLHTQQFVFIILLFALLKGHYII